MKKLICCMLLFVFAMVSRNAFAQDQPKWLSAGQQNAEYLFFPDIDTYYYVPRHQFIYQSGNYWTFSKSLPANHKSFNLGAAKKVVVNEPGAYRYFAEHKAKYSSAPANASSKSAQPMIKEKGTLVSGKTSG